MDGLGLARIPDVSRVSLNGDFVDFGDFFLFFLRILQSLCDVTFKYGDVT